MKKKKLPDLNEILKIAAKDLEVPEKTEPIEVPEPTNRIELGYVAINVQTNKATSGAYYSAGAKVYKSEAVARAATRHRHKPKDLIFVKAYAEIPEELATT